VVALIFQPTCDAISLLAHAYHQCCYYSSLSDAVSDTVSDADEETYSCCEIPWLTDYQYADSPHSPFNAITV
jgi:hypothetical protein